MKRIGIVVKKILKLNT